MERYKNILYIYPFWGLVLLSGVALCVYIFFICKKKDNNSIIYSLDNSNFIKSVSAIGLIFHHYALVMPTDSEVEVLLRGIPSAVGYLFSAVFLFSSGYGLAQKAVDWKLLRKRIIKLYIPYIITAFVRAYILKPEGGGIATFKQIVTFFAYINDGKFDGLWFIAAILYFNIIYCLSRFIPNRKINYTVNFGALFLWVLGCIIINAGKWWYNTSACFLLGILFADYGDKIKAALEKSRVKIFIIFLHVLIFIISACFGIQKNWIGREVSALIFCEFSYFICAVFDMKSGFLTKYIGRNTLEIYMLHGVILSCLYSHGLCKSGWGVCAATVLSLVVSYVIGRVNQKVVQLTTKSLAC